MKKYYPVITTVFDNGRASVVLGTAEEHENRPKDTYTNTSRRDIYVDWFDSLADARQFIKENQ